MIPAKVEDIQLLLEVFREGLVMGLISKEEIVAWADDIILREDDSDYFFIELSLSHDVNGLAEVLDEHIKQDDNPIAYRVVFGLIYHRRLTNDIDEAEKTATLVGSVRSWDLLTSFENETIWMFDDHYLYYSADLTQLYAKLNSFLSIYKAFTFENYTDWNNINQQVLAELKKEEVRVDLANELWRKEWAKKDKKKKLK